MERKIYNVNMVRYSTFLAGPLAGAYLISENYKTFGNAAGAKKTKIFGVVISVFIFGMLLLLPEAVSDKIPRFLLPILFSFLAQMVVTKYQNAAIENYLTEGGEKHSNWRVAGISLLILLITAVVLFAVIFIGSVMLEPEF